MNFKPYITRDAAICGGDPVVTGTQVTVRTILANWNNYIGEETLRDFDPRMRHALSRMWTEIKVRRLTTEENR